jgi:hypothetical protein
MSAFAAPLRVQLRRDQPSPALLAEPKLVT